MKTITPAGPAQAFQNLFIEHPGHPAREAIVLCAHRHDDRCAVFHYHATEAAADECYRRDFPRSIHARLLLWRCRGELLVRYCDSAWIAIETVFEAPAALRRLRLLAELAESDPHRPRGLAA